MGKVLSVTKSITGDGGPRTTAYAYDLSGKLVSMVYPDNYQVNYEFYPGTGLLHTVYGLSDFQEYAVYSDYQPTGKIGRMEHANYTATTYTYDPWSTKLLSILTSSPGPVQFHGDHGRKRCCG